MGREAAVDGEVDGASRGGRRPPAAGWMALHGEGGGHQRRGGQRFMGREAAVNGGVDGAPWGGRQQSKARWIVLDWDGGGGSELDCGHGGKWRPSI